MEFTTIRSEKVYTGRVFDVYLDEIRLPNGKLSELDIVQHLGAVTLVPVDDQGRLWMVRQYRHAARGELLELPAGSLEDREPAEDCAHREAREEIGMAAKQLELTSSAWRQVTRPKRMCIWRPGCTDPCRPMAMSS
jgi:ADP-ribose pyrophosphatase